MEKDNAAKSITVIVVCHNSEGDADVYEAPMRVRLSDIKNGIHHKLAISSAREDGYREPFVCFDDVKSAHKLARITEPMDSRFLRFGQLVAEIGRRLPLDRKTLDDISEALGMTSHQLIETFELAEDLRQSVESGNWKQKVPLAIRPLLH